MGDRGVLVVKIKIAPIGLTGLLTVLFAAAKLWGKIDWSWWWVFSPLWIPIIPAAVIFAVVFCCLAVKKVKL